MALEGWDHIPLGYGAVFDLHDAPWWLRLWFGTPFVDRYAHPVVVRRGYAFLLPHPHFPDADRETPGPGWRLRPRDHVPPGSDRPLHPSD